MKYFNEKEIMDLIEAIEAQDTWETDEMRQLVEAAVKESDEQLDPSAYDDPDQLYEDCKKVFGF